MADDYYELLEVASSATEDEIRAAITRQRRIWVRRQSSPDPDRRADAEQRVRDVDAAEKTLLDGTSRRAYDATRGSSPRSSAAGAGARDRRHGRPHPTSPSGRRFGDRPPRTHSRPDHRSGQHAGPSNAGTTGAEGSGSPAELDAHLSRGEDCLDQGRWRLAQAEFEYVRERAPDDLRAQLGLGAVHVGAGRVKQGLALLRQAAAEHPGDEDVKTALATALYDSAIAGLSEVGDARRRTRPMILSRRQLALVRNHRRQIKRLELTEWQPKMYVEDLSDLLAQARKAVWTRSENLRFYAVPFAGATLLAFLPGVESLRVLGAVWMVAILALYVVRHRQPGWKYHRRGTARPRRHRFGVFRKGI